MDHQDKRGGSLGMTLRLDDGKNANSQFAEGARNLRQHSGPVIDSTGEDSTWKSPTRRAGICRKDRGT